MLSAVDINYGGYNDTVAKSQIVEKHLTILLKVLWQKYIIRINYLIIYDLY